MEGDQPVADLGEEPCPACDAEAVGLSASSVIPPHHRHRYPRRRRLSEHLHRWTHARYPGV